MYAYTVRLRDVRATLVRLRERQKQKALNKNSPVTLTYEEFDDLLRVLQDLVEEVASCR